MSKAAFTLRVFAVYLWILGLVLVLDPDLLFSIFGIPETREVWIRVTGMLLLILGYYDFMASRAELVAFFRWSVHVRLPIPVLFVAFVALNLAPPVLILFGIVDAAAALWTAVCLRKDDRRES